MCLLHPQDMPGASCSHSPSEKHVYKRSCTKSLPQRLSSSVGLLVTSWTPSHQLLAITKGPRSQTTCVQPTAYKGLAVTGLPEQQSGWTHGPVTVPWANFLAECSELIMCNRSSTKRMPRGKEEPTEARACAKWIEKQWRRETWSLKRGEGICLGITEGRVIWDSPEPSLPLI